LTHPLVLQLRFTRGEFKRGLKGVSDKDGAKRLMPMNCISWNVGHLAWQEQKYFLYWGTGQTLMPEIHKNFAAGSPGSTPALTDMLAAWKAITDAADPWLDALTSEKLESHVIMKGKPSSRIFGALLQRVIYHYWYHTGENMAIRQSLGHAGLPEYVGNIDEQAPYRAEKHK
jgi:DinB superfamily